MRVKREVNVIVCGLAHPAKGNRGARASREWPCHELLGNVGSAEDGEGHALPVADSDEKKRMRTAMTTFCQASSAAVRASPLVRSTPRCRSVVVASMNAMLVAR
jgi:hypothetical protein